jgi:hypothetical protein
MHTCGAAGRMPLSVSQVDDVDPVSPASTLFNSTRFFTSTLRRLIDAVRIQSAPVGRWRRITALPIGCPKTP